MGLPQAQAGCETFVNMSLETVHHAGYVREAGTAKWVIWWQQSVHVTVMSQLPHRDTDTVCFIIQQLLRQAIWVSVTF